MLGRRRRFLLKRKLDVRLAFLFLICGLAATLSGCGGGTTILLCETCTIPTPPPSHISTTLTLTVASQPALRGQNATITATVTPAAASGTVSLTDITQVFVDNPPALATANLQQGTAVFALQPSNAGIRQYKAVYSGDGSYLSSQATINITVSVPASASSCGLGSSVYVLSAGTGVPAQTSFSSSTADESAVCAQNAGTSLTLVSPTITKSGGGNYSKLDPTGVDAAVLAYGSSPTVSSGASVTVQGASITATSAAYGAFASGRGAVLNFSNSNVSSTNSAATLGVGNNGQLTINNSTIIADRDPLVVLQGGSVVLQNTSLASTVYSGEIQFEGADSAVYTHFRMVGGALSSASPNTFPALPNFVVSGNNTADLYLSQVDLSKLTTSEGRAFAQVIAPATLALTLDHQSVNGSIIATPGSSLTLQNSSSLDGDFVGGNSVSLDASSSMSIHSTFALQVFNDPGGISGTQVLNVTGNGQTISYSNAMNPQLGGLVYSLQGGGALKPY